MYIYLPKIQLAQSIQLKDEINKISQYSMTKKNVVRKEADEKQSSVFCDSRLKISVMLINSLIPGVLLTIQIQRKR